MAILFGILAVSSASVLIRYAQGYAPSLVIAASRLSIATLALAPMALGRYWSDLRRLNRAEVRLGVLSGLFLAVHFATWISSLEYTSVANSVVLVTTTPLWVALFAPLTLREQLSRQLLGGVLLAFAGGVVVGLSDACSWNTAGLVCPSWQDFLGRSAFLGDFLALVGAWAAAGYLLIGRRLRAGMALIPYIFLVYGAAAVVLVLLMFSAGQVPWGYPPQAYLWFMLLALVPQLLGHSTFNWALGYLPAAFVSVTLMGEPVGSIILAYFLLQETPAGFKLLGAFLLLVGIYLASRGAT
jgi:drug/metabolite transporter (DMT)-like permease